MTYVSLAKSRAGWQPDEDKPREKKSRPETPAKSAGSSTNPDDGSSVSKPEEG